MFNKNEQQEILNIEERIINEAIKGFTQATQLNAYWEAVKEGASDGRLVINTGKRRICLTAQVKQQAMAHQLTRIDQTGHHESNALLLAGHIPHALKQTLRQTHQNYLDGAGNCFIQLDEVLLIVEGRKSVPTPAVAKQPFGKSGLRVLFTLLTQADSVNLGVRELAQQTGVSVGTVQYTLDFLKKAGYLVAIDKKRKKLTHVEKLREQWLGRYATALKPSLAIGRFRLPKNLFPDDWRQLVLQPGTYWSGEPAADALTNDLRPATLTLYTKESRAGLLKTYRLLPDPDGPLEVYELYWKPGTDENRTVPPLLIYADLLAIDDPRTTAIAQRIHHDFIAHA